MLFRSPVTPAQEAMCLLEYSFCRNRPGSGTPRPEGLGTWPDKDPWETRGGPGGPWRESAVALPYQVFIFLPPPCFWTTSENRVDLRWGQRPQRLLGRPDEALGGGNQGPSAPGWGRQHHSNLDVNPWRVELGGPCLCSASWACCSRGASHLLASHCPYSSVP